MVRQTVTLTGRDDVLIILNNNLMGMVTAYLWITNATIGNVGVMGTVPNSLNMLAAWNPRNLVTQKRHWRRCYKEEPA